MSGLYVHIPFCHSKCAYCDFYSTPSQTHMEEYVDALIAEAALRSNEIAPTDFAALRSGEIAPSGLIETIYFGGGTPSILPSEMLKRLVDGLNDRLGSLLSSKIKEFTIEVNPEDLSEGLINIYKSLGINRISMGVQTFDDAMLSALGRRHSGDDARRVLRLLSESGLNYSADLIFGLPGQMLDDWNRQLEELLSFRPPHFSAYLLSYEPGTRLYARLLAGKLEEASEELANAMYKCLIEKALRHGYDHYEISNYALPGYRAEHNSSYWDGTPYLGLGVSAHSFDGLKRRYNPNNIKDYISSVKNGNEFCVVEDDSEANRFNDALITALRTSRGFDLNDIQSRFAPEILKDFNANLKRYGSELVLENCRLRIPENLWLTSDAILRNLIVD